MIASGWVLSRRVEAASTSFALGNHAGSGPSAAGDVDKIGDRLRRSKQFEETQQCLIGCIKR